jgi:hypothetical protein
MMADAPVVHIGENSPEEVGFGLVTMGFGRLISIEDWRGDPSDIVYVVAEPDPAKAIDVLKAAGLGHDAEFEDLGRVTEALLNEMALQPGQFARAETQA